MATFSDLSRFADSDPVGFPLSLLLALPSLLLTAADECRMEVINSALSTSGARLSDSQSEGGKRESRQEKAPREALV